MVKRKLPKRVKGILVDFYPCFADDAGVDPRLQWRALGVLGLAPLTFENNSQFYHLNKLSSPYTPLQTAVLVLLTRV